ncbi:unnamed protein product [Brachionus calyciflorus]|uniref:tRNA (guanine(9)-N(1))-methyltransferase n=1 Tax=Brachionus calyciflorus TaxID=104777 RepID=A0A813ZJV1_9BILA|nr:unnamed protein product [Brachionus calyciflorus]
MNENQVEKNQEDSSNIQNNEHQINTNVSKRKRSRTEKKYEKYQNRLKNYKLKQAEKKRLKPEQEPEPKEPKTVNHHSGPKTFLNRRELREKLAEKLNQVYKEPQNSLKICIDCSFSDKMSSKEKSRLAKQIGRCYATNKSLNSPVHLTLCNLDQKSEFYKDLCRVNDGFDKYILDKTEQVLIDKFKDNKDNLCYLSPDAEEFLDSVDTEKIYVIGGLVDETVNKKVTLKKCNELKIKTYALPIEKYMIKKISDQDENKCFTYNKILAINQVFDILANYHQDKDWLKAFDSWLLDAWIVKAIFTFSIRQTWIKLRDNFKIVGTASINSWSKICNDFCNHFTYPNYPMNCFCTECQTFDDCCQNYGTKQAKNPTNYKCNSRIDNSNYIYTIGECPKNYDKIKIKKKCENINDTFLPYLIPVFSPETNLFFKNIYCAQCNVKDLKNITLFSIESKNDLDEKSITFNQLNNFINGDYMNSSYFDIFFIPPKNSNPRYCQMPVKTCPTNYSDKTIIEYCHNYTAYRYSFLGTTYKNEHCAFCNDENIDVLQCVSPIRYTSFVSSLQILFDLSNLNDELTINFNISLNNVKIDYNKTLKLENLNDEKCNLMLDEDNVKKYLTIIGQLVSILSLIILLFIYIRNKLHQNLPGKILIMLSLSLIFSQIFFLTSMYLTKSYIEKKFINSASCQINIENVLDLNNVYFILPCYLASMLTHFFYLKYFLWTSIMAYDLFKMFRKHTTIKSSDSLFLRYLICAWCLPLSIVIILQIKNPSRLSYGFKSCFISSTLDLLIFFIVPISFILILNIFFFVYSIYSIKKVDSLALKYVTKDSMSCSNNKQEKSRLLLYSKLFILSGMSWLLGIISSIINDKYSLLWYLYILLNSFQGLFIFCSYGFNKNDKSNFKSNFTKIITSFTKNKSSLKVSFTKENNSNFTSSSNVK